MDEFSQNIEDIEYLLKNRSNKKPLALYAGSEHKNKHGSNAESSKLSAKEVLANVSRQVKAMQNADSMGSKRVSNTINKFKKREFVPVNMIPVSNEVPLKLKLPTKFETQCVSDTQLINVIENAEIIDTHRGVTQEFDKTFCQKSDNDSDDKSDDGSLKSKTIESTDKCERDVTVSKDKIDNNNELCEIDTQDSQMFKDSDLTCAMDTITCCEDDVPIDVNDDVNLNNSQETQGFNECVEIFDTEIETERSSSPVLNTFKRNATPPLVVDLYTFEKFEDLAVPIIEEHGDLKLAKNMINSQILGREICIPNHFNEKIGRDSPVLSKIECITTNINKEEVEKICSCSNKCVDDEDVNLGTSNKKTESENKTELKDEILFSSDEEYEYLHKNVQELPLTCALETSFYDRSDVLDKTMYVGFQTASNKSIQINTDSFTKAKSILSDIGNEETGKSLSELVEIFDTGKIVSTDEETTNHTPNTVVEDENKEKATPFTITTDLKKSRDDTSVLFLTSLEEEEVKDDIVMSQIIPCKSLSRCSQINNSVIPDRKTSASVNSTALELNKDIDDDTIMSQVIQFKSIPRTPNVHNISTTNVSHETLHLNAGITKRKFEGFKTASNKKIKLSDKALARCNKVFQDIDLGDPDPYVSCDSNIVETEEKEDNFLDDLKSQDFNVSYDDDIKTISEKDHVVSATKMNPEVHDSDSKSELRIKEDQSEVNDVDLQINDNILLQEFEDNEMPLENNNNSFLGLKTASNRNIGVFADSVAPTANDCNNAIKNARNISEDKNEHIFKKPADISKSATSQTKSPVEILKIINNNDQERSNSEKHLSNEFIGFKTASHKEIIVSKQAMEKTKAIFKDIDEEVVNHTENDTLNTEKKQINNLTDDFNCGIDTQDFLAEELTHIEELFKDNIIEKQKSTSPIFQGFQTANKKPIVISEKALEKSKKLLEDITNKELDVKCNTIGNNSDTTSTNYANKNQIPVFTGFHTASNKKVVVSKKGIEASKTFFQDIVLSQQENEGHSEGVTEVPRNKIENLTSKVPVSDIEVIAITEITSQNRTNTGGSTSTDAEPPFVGFRTASAKPINISANALKTTKKLLNEFHLDGDIMFKEICDQRDEPSGFIGFQTASNKKITISDKALAKSKQMLNEFQLKDDIKNDNSDHIKNIQDNSSENTSKNHGVNDRAEDSNTNISSKFIGFQTASNKKVNISKEALAKSKQMFQNIGDKECDVEKYSRSDENTSRTGLGFKTASNKTVNISEKDLEISKRIFDDTNDLTKTDKGTPVFKGFQTASNKMVKISEKALAKSKKMFEDLNLSQLNKDPTSVLDKPVNNVDSSQISNNRTEVSEQSVAITKRIIKNVNHEEKNLAKNAITGFKGFQTASNKKVQISEEALSKSKRLFEDINLSQVGKDANITENVPKNNFVGFQTHNNKMVEVSEKALPTTKIIFKSQVEKSNDDIKEDTPIFKGFQTASNKKVEVSEKALAKSKRLFEDMNLSQLDKDTKTTDIHENKFVGFQTANNRVKASEQAIAKTKDMFKDVLETEEENVTKDTAPVFKGFQTANHKKVEISEAALARSKRLFEDLNLSQLDKDSRSTRENNFGGFQTANDKKVTVSAQALAKTKEVFEDIKEKENYDKGANETVKREVTSFKGFQTASNKKVVISENALSKCKQLFDDFNLSQLNNNSRPIIDSSESLTAKVNEENEVKNKQINNFGNSPRSSTSNKKVKISDEASVKSRNIFKDINAITENSDQNKVKEIRTPENKLIPSNNKDIVNDVIDTQVLNDFQDTLNTEDFSKSTPTSKRSGSPILSCPRAKKRKFETPYRTSNKIEPKNPFVPPKLAKTYNFNDNYKKDKKYTLKCVQKLEKEHEKLNTDPSIEYSFENLRNFEFKGKRNDYNLDKMSIEDLKKTFLGSVNKKILPDGWLDNHIKLIIWKLLSYEVKFPNVMENTCTVRNVLEQLKYRYDRELYYVQRPILRKILEKDEVPSKTMVLCVAAIYVDNVSVASVPQSPQNVELLLTDGWYCVKSCVDRMLTKLVVYGAISVGTKIAVCGAELMNCEQGVAPWEDTSSVRLKLHGNSTRRVRWDVKLGACTELIQCTLGAAKPDGGKMAVTRVVVTRVYPPLYVEKMEDGSTVTLSERLEQIRQMKYESERQTLMEKLYEEVEKEMSDQDSQDSEGYANEKCMESGSQISRNMKKSKDPDEYRSHLTTSQARLLESHASKQRERLIERVRAKFQKKIEENGLKTERNVVPLLKVRVAGLVENGGKIEITKGYLSIWKPSAAVLELVTEGAWIEILNVIPTGIRNSEIQLSAGRQTVFNPYKQKNDKLKLHTNKLQRQCYEIKEITQNPAMTTDHNEIDTVGLIFCIEPSTKDFKEQSFQNVYLADADKNIICVNFWGGLKKFGFENVLDTGQVVTCVNLQKRAGNSRKSIPQYRVTEFSYFTKTPKSKKALEITNELAAKLSKVKDKFCEDCLVLKNNYSIFKTRENENVTPYRFNYNIPKSIVSPLKTCDTNLNLTGLDFESSFNSQEISPQLLLRKKKVNEKIEKIRMYYGEPPPLSSIHILNKSKNASATYKSPLISNLERSKMESPLQNVASPSLGLQNVASPVTVNRTYVKNVNPVKLNFSSENLDDSVDHFAEEFDASPPLSLDSDILN